MSEQKMPVIFVGHGSPMNAIENNDATFGWKNLKNIIKRPKVIIAISPCWATDKLYVSNADKNKQIFDIKNTNKKLQQIKYKPKGSPAYAEKIINNLEGMAEINNDWGIDYSIWEILLRMYPKADIPVVMMSCNIKEDEKFQFEVGEKLRNLRDEGALILASGNIVHNLELLRLDDSTESWAVQFNKETKEAIINKDFNTPLDYKKLEFAEDAVPEKSEFYTLLTALGAVENNDKVEVFNDFCVMGSISMTSFIFGDINEKR